MRETFGGRPDRRPPVAYFGFCFPTLAFPEATLGGANFARAQLNLAARVARKAIELAATLAAFRSHHRRDLPGFFDPGDRPSFGLRSL